MAKSVHVPAIKALPSFAGRFGLKEQHNKLEALERKFKLPKLPAAYKKFYSEWKDHENEATPIHWVPKKEHFVRNEETGEVKRIQNRPIPVLYPNQTHTGIWGGCGIVQGMVKKGKYRRPVPWFWIPPLHKSVVYSEILDQHMAVTITTRALELIDESYGLDSYLLKNPAYELKSLLALKIKRKILYALANKDFCQDDLAKQQRLFEKYKQYMLPVDELEWYGLSVDEALAKFESQQKLMKIQETTPLKFQFRQNLIQKLRDEKSQPKLEGSADSERSKVSWMSKLNPFSKPTSVPDVTKRT